MAALIDVIGTSRHDHVITIESEINATHDRAGGVAEHHAGRCCGALAEPALEPSDRRLAVGFE